MSLPVQDLAERIQEEIEANPALEVLGEKEALSLDDIAPGDQEVESWFESSSDSGFRPASRAFDDDDSKRMFLEGAVARPETLQDHLLWQLRLQPISPEDLAVAEVLVANLGPEGFDIEPLETLFRPPMPESVPRMRALIQRMEPQGCCVADYRESLSVQASLLPGAPAELSTLVGSCLELVERGRHAEIRKRLGVDEAALEAALLQLKRLNPYPGRAYSAGEVRYVVPDLMVKPREGDFVIILNDEEIPVLGLNPFFSSGGGSAGKRDRQAGEFIKASLRDARFFIQSVHQRNRTLLKVARAIVEFQRNFFIKGPKYLVPLTLKDIAAEIGVHETTVSRIANRKHVQTEWGIYELRHFFTNSISGAGSGGSRYSKEGVKETIREMIQAEERPMSDQDIADALARRGISIARRTVAKYRGELKVDSSFGR